MNFPKVLIIGGKEYYGETAERDADVVMKSAVFLFNCVGDSIEIVTSGLPGIAEDFLKSWIKAGGKHFSYFTFSTEEEEANKSKENIKVVVSFQGGANTTRLLKFFSEQRVPIISFWGSGGASGGTQPYNGYVFDKKPKSALLCSTDADANPKEIAEEIAKEIVIKLPSVLIGAEIY